MKPKTQRSFARRVALATGLSFSIFAILFTGITRYMLHKDTLQRMLLESESMERRYRKAISAADRKENLATFTREDESRGYIFALYSKNQTYYSSSNLIPELINHLPRAADIELPPEPARLRRPNPPPWEPRPGFDSPPPPLNAQMRPGRPLTHKHSTAVVDGTSYFIYYTEGEGSVVAIIFSDATVALQLQDFTRTLLILLFAGIGVISLGCWHLSRRVAQPLSKLSAEMEHTRVDNLGTPISTHNMDREFAQLAEVFNAMSERLNSSFDQARRFSADAAHELQTPLTVLQGHIEQALTAADDEHAPFFAHLQEETQKLKAVISRLLLLAKADSGRLHIHPTTYDLSEQLNEMVEDLPFIAPHSRLTCSIKPNLRITADRQLLSQCIQNLFSNATKYSPKGSEVHISAQTSRSSFTLHVRNEIKASTPPDIEQLFSRFYRADPSRSTAGTGLGLSLAREIALAHRGSLKAQIQAKKITFVLSLPLHT